MLHSPSLEAFIDGTLTQYVPGAFLSGHLACSSPDGGYGVYETDFVNPSDLFDGGGGAPANDADTVADSIRSIYNDAEWPIPDEVA